MAAKKHIVYRKGGQISGSTYGSETHRQYLLDNVGKMSPFHEEILDANKKPIGLMVFNPMKVETEKSDPETDVYDPSTLDDADLPKGVTVAVFAPGA